MALKSGTQLGPYEILSPLGAGGMGEVYRARDTRLDRDVAVKVLPAHATDRPEARERFEREARAVSSLNHPNICTLHDVGTHEGNPYLVMEHLEGETLAARLEKGALPAEQTLRIAVEIGSALDRAHRSGIVHRDLKPGNVFLTKAGAKLLDFGLAKLAAPESAPAAGLSTLRTEDRNLTAEGTILGTFQYMSPEQIDGRDADARSDIFAFGAVLFEMATGRKAFDGKSRAGLVASILAADPPPVSSIQPMTPRALDHVVRRCLAKEPEDRWQNAGDIVSELRWIAEGGSEARIPAPVAGPRRSRERIWIAAAILLGIATVILASAALRGRAPVEETLMRFSMAPPDGVTWRPFNSFALSPDGKRLVYFARDAGGVPHLFLRSLDSLTERPLQGTDFGDASFPFWSPDSRFIGFFAGGKLKKIDVAGGPPQVLCDAPAAAGGTWNSEGVILFFFRAGSPVLRVPASGGEATAVTRVGGQDGTESHLWPLFLPDGRHFLYLSTKGQRSEDRWVLRAGELGSNLDEQVLSGVDSQTLYVPQGYLLYVRGGALFAQPFEAASRKLTGDVVLLAEQIGQNLAVGYGAFSASASGLLAYRLGGAQTKQVTWLDRSGRPLGVVGPEGEMADPEISPDGGRVALAFQEIGKKSADIWLLDLARGMSSRFSFDPSNELNPIWSGDGSRIYFVSGSKGHADIYRKSSSGAGEAEPVLVTGEDKQLEDVSADGRFLAYSVFLFGANSDLFILPLTGKAEPYPFLNSPSFEHGARFSQDMRFIAYVSNETGRDEVYVTTFPAHAGKWQISTNGGSQPRWRNDAREIYYLAPNSTLMAVSVKVEGTTLEAELPVDLFSTGLAPWFVRNHYAVSADGQKFLVGLRSGGASSPPIIFTVNWTAGLKKEIE